MSWITRLAKQAPVPVFVAIVDDAPVDMARLALHPDLSLVDSPRAAAILLVAGTLPDALMPHLQRLHDQLPHPRATVQWQSSRVGGLSDASISVSRDDDIVAALKEIRDALMSGARQSEPDLLPDVPPNEWRGVGPHGQGGKGMMGGTPYGRPMAKRAEDIRDGLKLDAYTADLGPFLPMFPPGLMLRLSLQGDVIQTVGVTHPPFDCDWDQGAAMLRLLGLPALGERSLRPKSQDDLALTRLIRFSGCRRAIPPGLGRTRDGSDVRDRFARLMAAPVDPIIPDIGETTLGDLLVGCEWHEAMLVLNSFDSGSLRRLCAYTSARDKQSGTDTQEHGAHDPHAGHTT
ncbi:hypothetical protein [Thioclava sp.]|uniref:hypothetical protein n=1 Tax=Thioclava sp. TaxID=1933450 RepID=UPI003AA844E3